MEIFLPNELGNISFLIAPALKVSSDDIYNANDEMFD